MIELKKYRTKAVDEPLDKALTLLSGHSRQRIFQGMPNTIVIPNALQHKRIELILLAENESPSQAAWEPDFLDKTLESILDLKRGD